MSIFFSENFRSGRKKNCFEGWYFRHTGEHPFSFIAGLSKCSDDPHCFIQYIDVCGSAYFRYDITEFSFAKKDMTISIAGNTFSCSGINANLSQNNQNIIAHIKYSKLVRYKKSLFAPSAMGPFSYLPMPCVHSIISMRQNASGVISKNGDVKEVDCRGYIEKDFGCSFPDNYFWLHAENSQLSIVAAVAWPLIFNIRGYICLVSDGKKQHNLSLYTGARLEYNTAANTLIFKKGKKELRICASGGTGFDLHAPVKNGVMTRTICEKLSAKVKGVFSDGSKTIPLDGMDCAYEIVLKE